MGIWRDVVDNKYKTVREMEVFMCVFFWHQERKVREERTVSWGKMPGIFGMR